jgi:hypothetical protein
VGQVHVGRCLWQVSGPGSGLLGGRADEPEQGWVGRFGALCITGRNDVYVDGPAEIIGV